MSPLVFCSLSVEAAGVNEYINRADAMSMA